MNALAAARAHFPNRDRRRALLTLALPIIGGMASQNILNLVDIAMVGRLGTTALAATGLGSFANWLSMAFILGLATGVQAICARRVGEGAHGEIAVPLNGGLMLALMLGTPLAAVLILFAPELLALINNDPAVVEETIPYLQVRLLALVFVGMNFSFRGYWSAVHRTGIYLVTLLVMHALNIVLNWVLIFGNLGAPAMGVTGAGLATTLSIVVGFFIYVGFGLKYAWSEGFLHHRPSVTMLKKQFKLSLPASLQQLFFSAGMLTLIVIFGLIGTDQLAAANVLMTLGLVIILPAIGLGIATATLVGNALGRGDVDDARAWGWDAALFTALVAATMGLIIALFGRPILGMFLTDPDVVALAWPALLVSCVVIGIDAAGLVLLHALLGAGDTGRVMKISLVAQWLLFLPVAALAGPVLGGGLLLVWVLQGLYRCGQTLWFARAWQQGRWQHIEV
ncbi:MATE family efflux transporter [Wenzhouxiangella sp. XN79A]|uniref:MATE family efflux transporter n=1 Tax=Wenzhouxiangella sp. XN79A TaxID=2724193 RepID=UPI00144AF629|nr:MATE family efflux transporter [Wenzhouxiangella sp. XN79A]NKI34263.1 MATE family efflux transporter [Wenzhouxiangella sp. XN79A]